MPEPSKLPVELNIRGVGGATAAEILGTTNENDVEPVLVDDQAGFYRFVDNPDADRIREAYEWGRLTSGGATHSIWWILLPFTLLNVAGWMFRPSGPASAASVASGASPHRRGVPEHVRSSLWWGRLIVVFGGLAMTTLYVMWLAVIMLELISVECAAVAGCTDPWYLAPLTWFGGELGWRIALGVFLTAAAMFLLLLFIVGTQRKLEGWEHDDVYRLVGRHDTSRLRRNTDLDDMRFWYKWEEHRRLLRWHVGTVMATLGGLGGYAFGRFSDRDMGFDGWTWLGIAGLTVLGIVALYKLTAPEGRGATATSSTYLSTQGTQLRWTGAHLGVGFAAGIAGYTIASQFPDDHLSIISGIRWLSTGLFWLALALAAVIGRRYFQDHRERRATGEREPGFRWAGPVVSAALALYVMGAGFGALTYVVGRALVGQEVVSGPRFNTSLVDILVLAAAVVALVALGAFLKGGKSDQGVLDDYWPPDDSGRPEAAEREAALTERERAWRQKVKRARFLAKAGQEADRNLTLLVVVMMILQAAQVLKVEGFNWRIWDWDQSAVTAPVFGWEPLTALHSIASWGVVLFLFPGVWLIRQTFRNRESRRQFAKVWDVISFWPRRYHPLAAPCYAERAVPEVRHRIKQLIDAGHPVIVSAHSQGTVIAFAALMQMSGEADHPSVTIDGTTVTSYEAAKQLLEQGTGKVPDGAAAAAPHTKATADQQSETSSYSETPSMVETQELSHVGMVTFGCPLTTLYGYFFPGHFAQSGRFERLRNQLNRYRDGRAWHNFYRPTDYIGREVFVAPGGMLTAADAAGADTRLREATGPLFPIESHSNYERHPDLEAALADLTAAVTPAETGREDAAGIEPPGTG